MSDATSTDPTVRHYASCPWCAQPMSPGRSCIGATAIVEGVTYRRRTEDSQGAPRFTDCHDCNAPAGGLHHPGCDSERCPRCLGQAIGCGCRWEGDEPDPEWDPEWDESPDEHPDARRVEPTVPLAGEENRA